MGFFDLNIPYDEASPSDKASRIKLVIKAMELGYAGIAYNRTFKGVMSDRDRCSIPLLSLSSLLKLAPSLSSSVEFHRDLLGVPRNSPFRQFTRLTFCVDSPTQAQALNSGNPILKTYDLVAVKPLNQNAFDQACERLEVDIIAIDFSEKLPFRLKLPMIKAAIERGVYFEITYSKLLADVQARRQIIPNAKLLVDWTRGKNLIFSSAALSVNELRGPNDAANLSSLLGLSMERAKSAISKNCRALVANALRKKQFYKETIKVEMIPSDKKFDLMELGSLNWLKWDPISSGEGDLQLDDLAKSFAASSRELVSKKDGMPLNGFRVRNSVPASEDVTMPLNYMVDTSLADDNIEQPPVSSKGLLQEFNRVDLHSEQQNLNFDAKSQHQCSGNENSQLPNSPIDAKVSDNEEEIKAPRDSCEEKPRLSDVDFSCTQMDTDDLQAEYAGNLGGIILVDASYDADDISKRSSDSHGVSIRSQKDGHGTLKDYYVASMPDNFAMNQASTVPTSESLEDVSSALHHVASDDGLMNHPNDFGNPEIILVAEEASINKDSANLNSESQEDASLALDHAARDNDGEVKHTNDFDSSDQVSGAENISRDENLTRRNPECQEDLSFPLYKAPVRVNFEETKNFREPGGKEITMERVPYLRPCAFREVEGDSLVVNKESPELMEECWKQGKVDNMERQPSLVESLSGKSQAKRGRHIGPLLFPFKRLLGPMAFKRKLQRTRSSR